MIGTRVLKKHIEAVRSTIGGLGEADADPDEVMTRIASAVLTAYDDQMRYVVVTDDYLAFGPYATRESARKAIDAGLLAHREGTKAMVLAMKPTPRRTSAGRDKNPKR